MKFRLGTTQDLPWLVECWDELASELERAGVPEPIAGPKTVRFYRRCFEAHLMNGVPGIVLIAETDDGVRMGAAFALEPELTVESRHGKFAVAGLGTYVLPEHRGTGVAKALVQEEYRQLSEMGFDHIVGEFGIANPRSGAFFIGQGFEPFAMKFARPLP